MCLSAIYSVLLFIVILAIASSIGTILISRLIPAPIRVASRVITQPSFTVIGMMFSVILGFFIQQGIKNFTDANMNVVEEANALGMVFRCARGISEPDRTRIRILCREYAQIMINQEWPAMANCTDSGQAWGISRQLFQAVLSVQPHNQRENCILQSMINAGEDLASHRRVRVARATAKLNLELWLIIALGASAIVCITFLFAPENKRFHAGLLLCILLPIVINIFLLAEYSFPYSGFMPIKPTMFQVLQRRLFIEPDTPLIYLPPQDASERKQS